MDMIGKIVALTCLGTFAAGAQTIVFNGCNNTPNKYFTFTAYNGNNNHIAKVSLKNNIPADACRDITLVIPAVYERNGQQYQTCNEEEAFSDVRDKREVDADKRLNIRIKLEKRGNEFVKMPKNCEGMFANSGFVEIDLWGIGAASNITNTKMMFWGCNRLEKVNFGNFNASGVTNMQSMFQYCCKLKELDLSKFNASNVTDMSLLFMECNKLEDLDITSFNTSNVTTMQSMFNGCHNIKRLDLSNFNTKNVKNMAWMFDKCKNLEKIKLNSFRTHNVKDMCYMFRGCSKLQNLDLSSFSITDTLYGSMLEGCNSLVFVKEPRIKTYEQKQYIYGHVFSTIHSLMKNNGTELADLI